MLSAAAIRERRQNKNAATCAASAGGRRGLGAAAPGRHDCGREVDSIYLTKEDLDAIMAVDLSGYPNGYEQARDIFMIGVWTAQRVSDYNYIKKEDFSILAKNVMKEKPTDKYEYFR